MDISDEFDVSLSNFILMIGSRLLFLFLLAVILFQYATPVAFPATAVRNMMKQPTSTK
jgi:hypothetical protein